MCIISYYKNKKYITKYDFLILSIFKKHIFKYQDYFIIFKDVSLVIYLIFDESTLKPVYNGQLWDLIVRFLF